MYHKKVCQKRGTARSYEGLYVSVLCVKSCLPLCNPMTAVHQAPLFMGFSRHRYWSGLPCPPPGDLSNPGIEPWSPALQADSLPSEAPGKSLLHITAPKNSLVFSKMIGHLYSF